MAERFSCRDCGFAAAKWFGRCPDCGAWSSASAPAGGAAIEIVRLSDAGASPERIVCGIREFDRVLGGGIVAGSVILLAGEPGIGKSTLVLEALAELGRSGRDCLLITGEESLAQVASRATRLEMDAGVLQVAASTSLQAAVTALDERRPDVLVIDSIQTLHDESLDQTPGSPTQVRHSSACLVELAKRTGTAVVLVGHVTKEGSVAGPKTLEHVVDTVLTLDGERSGTLRFLRAVKNRFGPCDETGVFVMGERGLEPVADPSAMFLEDRRDGIPGSVAFPALDGTRPLLVEIQALVTEATAPQPRRVTIGLDARRFMLVAGVILEHGDISLAGKDAFVAAAGGLTVKEPACDLAIALACRSAVTADPIDPSLVAIGELGLGGEIRRIQGVERRLAEAARLGFRRALVPKGNATQRADIEVVPVSHIGEALDAGAQRDSLGAAPSPARA
jgi:DNA repair protein RadA/Sms